MATPTRILAWLSRRFCSRMSSARKRRSEDLSALTLTAVALRIAATSAAAASLYGFLLSFELLDTFRIRLGHAFQHTIKPSCCSVKGRKPANARYLVCFTNYAHLRWVEGNSNRNRNSNSNSKNNRNRKGSLAWPSFTW